MKSSSRGLELKLQNGGRMFDIDKRIFVAMCVAMHGLLNRPGKLASTESIVEKAFDIGMGLTEKHSELIALVENTLNEQKKDVDISGQPNDVVVRGKTTNKKTAAKKPSSKNSTRTRR